MERDELADRLGVIEAMIAEGRRHTEYWGWAFILWGLGHLVAAVWGQLHAVAWPVTMTACGVLTGVFAYRQRRRGGKSTAAGRTLATLWASLGGSLFVAMIGGMIGDSPDGSVVTIFFLVMGAASVASGVIVRWPWWSGLGLLWWGAALGSMIAGPAVTFWLFVAMAAIGEVGFGVYLMILERREPASGQAAGS